MGDGKRPEQGRRNFDHGLQDERGSGIRGKCSPTHQIARWPTLRDEFPLPAERGEGQGEGCLGNTKSFSGNVFKAFPSPRPSPRSFLAGRGRRRSAACSPCLCRLSCGLLYMLLNRPEVIFPLLAAPAVVPLTSG